MLLSCLLELVVLPALLVDHVVAEGLPVAVVERVPVPRLMMVLLRMLMVVTMVLLQEGANCQFNLFQFILARPNSACVEGCIRARIIPRVLKIGKTSLHMEFPT